VIYNLVTLSADRTLHLCLGVFPGQTYMFEKEFLSNGALLQFLHTQTVLVLI